MIDLSVIIQQYPHCLETRAKLAGILHDCFPGETREVNLALAAYDCGIAVKIHSLKQIDSMQMNVFLKTLEKDYGLQGMFAVESISLWANAYQCPIDKQTLDTFRMEPAASSAHRRRQVDQRAITSLGKNSNTISYPSNEEKQSVMMDKTSLRSSAYGQRPADQRAYNDGEESVNTKYLFPQATWESQKSSTRPLIPSGSFSINSNDYELQRVGFRKYEIKKFIGIDEQNMIVPSVIDGKKIIGIGSDAYRNCLQVENLIIEEGIEYICKGAFDECKNLKNVRFPDSMTVIGKGNDSSNNANTNFYLPSTSHTGTFAHSGLQQLVLPSGLSYIGDYCFYNCKELKSIVFPGSLNKISNSCCEDCSKLESVTINNGTLSVGDQAFKSCSQLKQISLPSTISMIGVEAFSSTGLTDVQLNDGLQSIGKGAFLFCNGLKTLEIPNSVNVIEGNLQKYDNLSTALSTFGKAPVTIVCEAGSTALDYARKNGYPVAKAFPT